MMPGKTCVLPLSKAKIYVLIIGIVATSLSLASDQKREQSYQQDMQFLKVGELVSLEANKQNFSAIYTGAPKNSNHNAALILHDMGAYPDQQLVVRELRSELPQHQWSTLSLQMPVREVGTSVEDYYALFPEAVQRIQVGIDYLTKLDLQNIVLVGYGLGALMAVYAVSEQNIEAKALVAISLPVAKSEHPNAQTLAMLKKLNVPLLDIYAEKDLPDVIASAQFRRLAIKDNSNSRQMTLLAEDHNFLNQNGLLAKRIQSWLTRTLSAIEAEKQPAPVAQTQSELQPVSQPQSPPPEAPTTKATGN